MGVVLGVAGEAWRKDFCGGKDVIQVYLDIPKISQIGDLNQIKDEKMVDFFK